MSSIAGGGTAGLALACALADALGPARRIAVADRAQLRAGAGPGDARAFALSAGSKRLLAVLGVWPAIAAHAQPVTAHRHHRLEPRRRLPPGARLLRQHRGGGEPATYIVEQGAAARCLAGGARQPACDRAPRRRAGRGLRRPTSTASPSISAAKPRCAPCARRCSSPPTAAVSRLREAAGIGVVRWSYPQVGIVTTVRTSSRTTAAPCSISCPPARSPSCR